MKKLKFLELYKNKKILVTGSSGFKGSWLCFWLHLLKANVVGISLKIDIQAKLFNALGLKKKIIQYNVDIKNFKKLNNIIKKEKPDIIFHLAAQSIVSESFKNPLSTFNTNIIGSANVLESVRKNRIKNLVFITSDKCYLNVEKKKGYKENDKLGGHDNYSSSKASAELIFDSYSSSFFKNDYLQHATARAGNVIGGGDFKINRILPDIIKSLKQKKTITLRNPKATRPWQHVLEPVFAYLLLGSKLIKKKINKSVSPHWNFGPYPYNCKSVLYITKNVEKIWGNNTSKISVSKNKKFLESNLLSLNISKAKNELDWKPTLTLKECLELTVNWYKNFFSKKIEISQFTENQIKYFLNKIKHSK